MSWKTRRSFLRQSATGIALTGLVGGKVLADRGGSETYSNAIHTAQVARLKSQMDIDIGETDLVTPRVREALDFDEQKDSEEWTARAEEILDGHNITHVRSKDTLDRDSADNISTHGRFGSPDEDSDTEVHIDLYENDDYDADVYDAWITFELGEKGGNLHNSCPVDGAAMYWDQDTYTRVAQDGRDNFHNEWTYGNNVSGYGISYDEIDAKHGGILAEVESGNPATDGQEAYLAGGYMTRLEVTGSDTYSHPITAKYKHSYRNKPVGCTVVGSGAVSLSAGFISISGTDISTWKMSTYERI